MNLVVLDHETYYDQEYSLSKMSTEEYVTDSRYQTIMVSIKVNDNPVKWTSGTTQHVTEWLHDHKVHESAVICHNHMFDGLVDLIHHGFVPPILMCTRFMAKAVIQPYVRSVSLDSCLKYINSPFSKGDYVENMRGRRRESLSASELRDYSAYCCRDTEATHFLFHWLAARFPRDEYAIIDMTLRMYLEPKLIADPGTFARVLYNERTRKEALLAKLPPEVQRADLMSNVKFAEVLAGLGIDPPTKISPTTGKRTWAFAKNDPEWKDLEEELADDPVAAPILAARLGTKSTIGETRAERLMNIGRNFGMFRVPLIYYSAHTGRYGGTEKINPQNFTRVKKEKGKPVERDQLRFGLQAPANHVVLAVDASQIEARINAWLAGCDTLLELFARGADVYSTFASDLFRRPITKANERERFIGKTCILGLGYGMGGPKLRATLRKDNIAISAKDAEYYTAIYRSDFDEIPALWAFCNGAIGAIREGGKMRVGPCVAMKGKIILPNGMQLDYPNLKYVDGEKYKGWAYTYAGRFRTLWGGKVVENIVQSLARIKITDAMREINKELKLRPVLQAHDELVYVVPDKHAADLLQAAIEILSRPPLWAPNLPLSAEGGFGHTYGDCK